MINFYATIAECDWRQDMSQHLKPGTSVLLPASSFIPRNRVPIVPDYITDRGADCGGFVATFKWGGVYRYTPKQYVEWLSKWQPTWAATMDFCCENEITSGNPGIVYERQRKTSEMAWHFWTQYRDMPWVWVPTIQGWTIEEYERHARFMAPMIREMQRYYGPTSPFRVGIGTLCRRDSWQTIHGVVRVVSAIIPGVPLHLWGVKLTAMQSRIALPEQIVSVDSAAWNGSFGKNIERWKASGQRRSAYCFASALPEYQAKIELALSKPKQGVLL